MTQKDGDYDITLSMVYQDRTSLDGTWLYIHNKGATNSPVSSFEATKDRNGHVWPKATLQVRDEKTGEWTTVGTSSSVGKKVDVKVPAGSDVDLWVQLDAFKPFVGKATVGKVILTNGQELEFRLHALKPPDS